MFKKIVVFDCFYSLNLCEHIENVAYAAVLSSVITLRQCQSRHTIFELIQESCDNIGRCLKVMTLVEKITEKMK